jgi:hypothetical protein
VTTPLSELVSRLALLAGPHAYVMTARLLQDKEGIELKATSEDPVMKRVFVLQVSFGTLDDLGADAVAKEFVREARKALAGADGLARPRGAHAERRSKRGRSARA